MAQASRPWKRSGCKFAVVDKGASLEPPEASGVVLEDEEAKRVWQQAVYHPLKQKSNNLE
eukprot:9116378-Prorocentrum_lima.AAC.1